MNTKHNHLQVTLQAIVVAAWAVWADYRRSADTTLRTALRGMAGVSWFLWASYWEDLQQRRAFERRFPIPHQQWEEARSPLFIIALVVVALTGAASALLPEVR